MPLLLQFNRMVFILHTGFKYDISHWGCVFFLTIGLFFEFLANFLNFEIMV